MVQALKQGNSKLSFEDSYKGCPSDPMFWFGSNIGNNGPMPILPKCKERLVVLRPIGGYEPETHKEPSFLGKEIEKVNGLR